MPNDMSPSAFRTAPNLANRTARYCARAADLVADPSLTAPVAERALQHLSDLQMDLARQRLAVCKPMNAELRMVEDDFKPLEARLKQARADLSNAVLRAKPDDRGASYGLVPHGSDLNAVIEDTTARPMPVIPDDAIVQPVSACRALLDLETLRPFLSDHALRQAIAKHAQETGQFDIQGVAYAALPATAQLPCEVL